MPTWAARTLAALMVMAHFAPSLWAATYQRSDEVKAQLERIRDQANAPKNGPFDELARMESAEGLAALVKSLGLISADAAYPMLFSAVSVYGHVDELREEALEFTIRHADSNTAAIAGSAARNLPAFGEEGRDALWNIARTGRNAMGRAYAIGGLRAQLTQSADPEALGVILNGIQVPESGRRQQVERLLRAFTDAASFRAMSRYCGGRKVNERRGLLILSALNTHVVGTSVAVDDGVTQVLVSAIEGKNLALQFRGLTLAVTRGSSMDAALLESLARSEDDSVRRAAFEAGMIGPSAPFHPNELAQSRDPIARQAAAVGFAKQSGRRSANTVAMVHTLLNDEDRVVQLEAVGAIEAIRAKESIPVLIEILRVEMGRLRGDALRALKGLTGRDYGLRSSAWTEFWKNEGDSFRVPSKEEIQRAELEAAQKKKQGSRAEFYGIEIHSHQFALIVDTSGSMLEPAYSGKTRIAVAKRELMQILERLKDGTLFNIISFDAVARPMGNRLEKVSTRAAAKARKYVKGLRADGGTNVYDALKAAFDDPLIDTIYLMTDGDPTVGKIVEIDALRAEVVRWNYARRVAIHCVAVGQNHELLRGLAEDHGGTYVVVY